MKVSDYVAAVLAEHGVRHVFVVQGGAVAHLIDSVAKRDDMRYICSGHEQAAAIAVHGYAARVGGFGCAVATTGPGVMNLINGVACLYYDSLPSIFIGGQVTTARYRARELGVRQLGFQESPHAEMMRLITKYSTTVTDKTRVRYELEKAIYIAKSGRPGPVFLDICDDVQYQDVDPEQLKGYAPPGGSPMNWAVLNAAARRTVSMLREAQRPVLVIGGGARAGGYWKRIVALAEALGVPCMTTWGAFGCMPTDHPLNAGSFGLHGGRAGNFTVQNADLLVGLGVRFTQHQTGTPASNFARGARKIVVDVDPAEIGKLRAVGVDVDLAVCSDLGPFLDALGEQAAGLSALDRPAWLARISEWRRRYRPGQDRSSVAGTAGVDPYAAIAAISDRSSPGDFVLGDVGATLSWMFQAWRVKPGQTLLTAFNNHTMGYALPAAVGVALANPGAGVWSLSGDGGILMNIQELGVLARHGLPVKVVVLNNRGYGVIQQTQEDYFEGRFCATTEATGLMAPDFVKVAEGFGVAASRVGRAEDLEGALAEVARATGPHLLEIEVDPAARIRPAVVGTRPIEDASPLLPRDELRANMIVEPIQ
jgi:acetolactate synthase I/II/III large subunit